jgi:NAD(P)-dependent dehydrogenase (short-subunit alcohol dehydrogenase family)
MKKKILIIGGTSGVGLELAKHYVGDGHTVCVTGRQNPDIERVQFQSLSIESDESRLALDLDRVVEGFRGVNTLIYSAGFLQRGHIDALSDDNIQKMVNVGLLAPMMLIQRLKNKLKTPLKIMLITSSSQYTARELEPAYCATKAGLGMLGESLVRDMRIGKVLVVAPSGINTKFWSGTDQDTSTMLDPKWVAEQTVKLSSGTFKYKYAHLLRNPARVEIRQILNSELNEIVDD